MTMYKYKNKQISIVGLSVEGVDSAKFFCAQGARVICRDRRSHRELSATLEQLRPYHLVFQLGPGYLEGLNKSDEVVRSPGVSPLTPELFEYAKKIKPVTSLTKLFFENCRGRIVGVTGTKGKGTTSTLIARLLEASGKKVYLGGNVGVPLLSQSSKIKKTDWVVLELSSFQLEDMNRSPNIAVVLRITQDHLANFDTLASNFHETRADYLKAKESIVSFQGPQDWAVFNSDCPVNLDFSKKTPAQKFWYSRSGRPVDAYVKNHTVFLRASGRITKICSSSEIKLYGDHNLENIAAATLTARILKIPLRTVRKTVSSFAGLEHRLEFVREVGRVSYINDSFSTVPETAVAAIDAFDRNIILISGGSEKKSDFAPLGEKIAHSRVKILIAIGDMTERIVTAANNFGYRGKIITGLKNMHDIVAAAKASANPGDVVVMSPACASFDMFKNYKERGRLFKHEVANL